MPRLVPRQSTDNVSAAAAAAITSTTSSSPNTATTTANVVPVGAIVGSALAACLLVSFLVSLFLLRRRSKTHPTSEKRYFKSARSMDQAPPTLFANAITNSSSSSSSSSSTTSWSDWEKHPDVLQAHLEHWILSPTSPDSDAFPPCAKTLSTNANERMQQSATTTIVVVDVHRPLYTNQKLICTQEGQGMSQECSNELEDEVLDKLVPLPTPAAYARFKGRRIYGRT